MKDYWYSQVKETVTYSYCRILADAMKRSGDVKVAIYFNKLAKKITERVFKPEYYVLDDKSSSSIKQNINRRYITYHLSPFGNHRTNNFKIAIHTFKNHMLTGLCTVDPSLTLKL